MVELVTSDEELLNGQYGVFIQSSFDSLYDRLLQQTDNLNRKPVFRYKGIKKGLDCKFRTCSQRSCVSESDACISSVNEHGESQTGSQQENQPLSKVNATAKETFLQDKEAFLLHKTRRKTKVSTKRKLDVDRLWKNILLQTYNPESEHGEGTPVQNENINVSRCPLFLHRNVKRGKSYFDIIKSADQTTRSRKSVRQQKMVINERGKAVSDAVKKPKKKKRESKKMTLRDTAEKASTKKVKKHHRNDNQHKRSQKKMKPFTGQDTSNVVVDKTEQIQKQKSAKRKSSSPVKGSLVSRKRQKTETDSIKKRLKQQLSPKLMVVSLNSNPKSNHKTTSPKTNSRKQRNSNLNRKENHLISNRGIKTGGSALKLGNHMDKDARKCAVKIKPGSSKKPKCVQTPSEETSFVADKALKTIDELLSGNSVDATTRTSADNDKLSPSCSSKFVNTFSHQNHSKPIPSASLASLFSGKSHIGAIWKTINEEEM